MAVYSGMLLLSPSADPCFLERKCASEKVQFWERTISPDTHPRSPQKPAAFKSVKVLQMRLIQPAHTPPPPCWLLDTEMLSCGRKTAAVQGLCDPPPWASRVWFCGLRPHPSFSFDFKHLLKTQATFLEVVWPATSWRSRAGSASTLQGDRCWCPGTYICPSQETGPTLFSCATYISTNPPFYLSLAGMLT